MKSPEQVPYYAADGRSLGFRTLDAAERLVAGGFVKASYGRKKNLRAIWACQDGGGNPVDARPRSGTRYSFLQNLETGRRCWKHRKVDGRDDNGQPVSTRGVFLQVIADCMAS